VLGGGGTPPLVVMRVFQSHDIIAQADNPLGNRVGI
jgi:hypothetical protein